jgi:hypothetical protein
MNFYEMSSLSTKRTKLPLRIFISIGYGSRHGARLKVSKLYGDRIKKGELFSITIVDNPKIIGDIGEIKGKDIEKVIGFIMDNKELLFQFWEQNIDYDTFIEEMIV